MQAGWCSISTESLARKRSQRVETDGRGKRRSGVINPIMLRTLLYSSVCIPDVPTTFYYTRAEVHRLAVFNRRLDKFSRRRARLIRRADIVKRRHGASGVPALQIYRRVDWPKMSKVNKKRAVRVKFTAKDGIANIRKPILPGWRPLPTDVENYHSTGIARNIISMHGGRSFYRRDMPAECRNDTYRYVCAAVELGALYLFRLSKTFTAIDTMFSQADRVSYKLAWLWRRMLLSRGLPLVPYSMAAIRSTFLNDFLLKYRVLARIGGYDSQVAKRHTVLATTSYGGIVWNWQQTPCTDNPSSLVFSIYRSEDDK